MATTLNSLRFESLALFLTRTQLLRGRRKTDYVRKFLQTLLRVNRKVDFTFGILRLLLPSEDRDRGSYGLKEKVIAKVVAEVFSVSNEDFQRMSNFRDPTFNPSGVGVGDFGSCVADTLKSYSMNKSTLSIEEVNVQLDSLATQGDKTPPLRRLLTHTSVQDLKWVMRILLRDLKVGLRGETVLAALHPQAPHFFDLTCSLKETCRRCEDPRVQLHSEVNVFLPVSPMLAGRKPLNFQGGALYAQTKYDGERLQVHKKGNEVRLYSRSGLEFTQTYEGVARRLKSIKAEGCVLDGQLIVVESSGLLPAPFGLNKSEAVTREEGYHLCFMLFDVLWLRQGEEERVLLKYPLSQRKVMLKKIIVEERGRIQLVQFETVSSQGEVMRRFQEGAERGDEGLVLKDPNQGYLPRERGWVKLKADYMEGLSDSMDLIILGGYFGEAARSGNTGHWSDKLTSFLVGVLQTRGTRQFALPFAKVGIGFSQQDFAQVRQRLRPILTQNCTIKPAFLAVPWKAAANDRPDCVVQNLQQSFLLEVRAAQIIPSQHYPPGFTFRFPRFLRIRTDKLWSQGLTRVQVLELIEHSRGTLKRKHSEDDLASTQPPPSSKRRRQIPHQQVLDHHQTGAVCQSVQSSIFAGCEFAVLPMPNRQEIERNLRVNGGSVVQNPVKSTIILIAERVDFTLRAYAEAGEFLFVKPCYITDCIEAGKVFPPFPMHLTLSTALSGALFADHFDTFGDSYTYPLSASLLNSLLESPSLASL